MMCLTFNDILYMIKYNSKMGKQDFFLLRKPKWLLYFWLRLWMSFSITLKNPNCLRKAIHGQSSPSQNSAHNPYLRKEGYTWIHPHVEGIFWNQFHNFHLAFITFSFSRITPVTLSQKCQISFPKEGQESLLISKLKEFSPSPILVKVVSKSFRL